MRDSEAENDIRELRTEAAEARQLAATFEDGPTVTDLLNYASALDREAGQLEKASPEPLPFPRRLLALPPWALTIVCD